MAGGLIGAMMPRGGSQMRIKRTKGGYPVYHSKEDRNL